MLVLFLQEVAANWRSLDASIGKWRTNKIASLAAAVCRERERYDPPRQTTAGFYSALVWLECRSGLVESGHKAEKRDGQGK